MSRLFGRPEEAWLLKRALALGAVGLGLELLAFLGHPPVTGRLLIDLAALVFSVAALRPAYRAMRLRRARA